MDKLTALSLAAKVLNLQSNINTFNSTISGTPLDIKVFLEIISREKYNLAKELKYSATKVSKMTSILFPEREKTSNRLDVYMLSKIEYKYCAGCKKVFSFDNFRANKARSLNLNTYCKDCHLTTVSTTQKARTAKYKSAKLQRTPSWADLSKIKEIYDKCPTDCHVDHIVPLQGHLVCGLHVENNLQYLTVKQNLEKGNTYIV